MKERERERERERDYYPGLLKSTLNSLPEDVHSQKAVLIFIAPKDKRINKLIYYMDQGLIAGI